MMLWSVLGRQADNTLLIVAQLQIILTFIGGFLLAGRPFELDESLLGWALLLFDLAVVMVAVWMQHKHGSATVRTELQVLHAHTLRKHCILVHTCCTHMHTHCAYVLRTYTLHMCCS